MTLSYDRLGHIVTRADQRGTISMFNLDKLGRPTDDRVTTNGSGTDVAVKRITSTYEVRVMVATLTSYDNATVGSGSVLNQGKCPANPVFKIFVKHGSMAPF